MILLSKPTKVLEKKENKGVFEIEALYPGYGVTMGNSLRRVLLSSLEGAAVTQVKIKGIPHEFSTIDGVKEDVVTIILNLKKLRFRMYSDESQQATLKVKGEKEVTGSDFKFPPTVELISKDSLIAHLTSKAAELEMEIQIEKGIGYVPAEARKKQKEEIGIISLDAIFTPIQKVSYRVEHMRVGDRTDFDRLTLEIETDGTVDSEEVLHKAATILVEQYNIVRQSLKEQEQQQQKKTKAAAEEPVGKVAAKRKTVTKTTKKTAKKK